MTARSGSVLFVIPNSFRDLGFEFKNLCISEVLISESTVIRFKADEE